MIARTLACLCFGLVFSSLAQAQNSEAWGVVGLNARLHQLVSLSLEEQLRIADDPARLDALNSELTAALRPLQLLRIEGLYRLAYRRDRAGTSELEMWHRFAAGVRADYDIGRWRMDARVRYQAQLRWEGIDRQEHALRARMRVGYRRHHTTVFVAYEFWARLAEDEEDVRAQQGRASVGIAHDFGSMNVGFELRHQHSLQRARSAIVSVVSVGFDLDAR